MKIKIYKSTADNRVVNKTNYMTLIYSNDNSILKKDTSIMNIELSFSVTNAQITELKNCNYVYIEELESYYYINDIRFEKGNICTLICSEDVLMTYKEQIYLLDCIIERQENKFNTYLDDPEYKVYNYRRIQTLEFPNGFNKNDCQFILTIAGSEE